MLSDYGMRGVSRRDQDYFPGTGYWTGPVWVSVNYLFLRGLYKNYLDFEPSQPINEKEGIFTAKDLYDRVRQNLIDTVYSNWEPRHIFYENYNDVTGEG